MSIQKKDTIVGTITTSQLSLRSAFNKYSCQPSQFQLESIAQNKTRRHSSGSVATQITNSTPATTVLQIKTSLQNQGLPIHNAAENGMDVTGSRNNLSNIAELSHTNLKILPSKRSNQSMEDLFDQLDNPETTQVNIPKMFIVKDHQAFSHNSLSPATATVTELRNLPHFSAISSTPVQNSLGIGAPNSRPHSFTEIKLERIDMNLIKGERRRSAFLEPTKKLFETAAKDKQGISEPSSAKSVIPTRSNFWKSSFLSLFSKKRVESRSGSIPVTTTSHKKPQNKGNKNHSTFWRRNVLPLFTKKKYTVNNNNGQKNEEVPHQINIENDEDGAENVDLEDEPHTAEIRTLPRGIESQSQLRDSNQDPESGPTHSGGILELPPSPNQKPIDLLKPPSLQEKVIEKPAKEKTIQRSITQHHTGLIQPPTTTENKEKIKLVLSIIAFIIASAIILTAIDSIISHSFQNRYIFYWIDEFFFGFLLAAGQIVFLRAMIQSNLKELLEDESAESSDNLEEAERPKPKLSELYKYRTVNMISAGVLIVSSLTCSLISYGTLHHLAKSPFYYLLLGFIILIIDGLLITLALRIRNKIAMKNALKKRGKGFFVIPVYRDFMQDLSSTRSALNLSASNRSHNPLTKPEVTKDTMTTGRNNQLKLQKQDYEVISNERIIASQGLFILFYLQFVSEVGFAYLYRHLQQIDNKISILVILVHPIISFAFRKAAEYLNFKAKLSMEIYITFVNWLIVGIFSKITFLFIEGIGLIAETIAVKLIYKGVIYVFIKKEAEAWNKKNLLNLGNIVLREQTFKAQKTLKKPEFQRGSARSSSIMMENVKRRTRLNTIMQVKLVEKERLDAARKKDKEEYSHNFMIKAIFIELSDLIFGLSAIILVVIYRIAENSSVFYSIESKFVITYVVAGVLEILLGLPIVLCLYHFWIKKSKLIDIKVREILQPFWKGYFKEFFVVNAMFFLNFIAIIQIFYGKLCCIEA